MYDEIFDNGIIRIKNKYIRIIEVFPINFNFKSDLEKESILENYKNIFKSLKLDFQICVFSQKEDFTNYFNQIKNNNQKENEIKEEYEIYLTNLIKQNDFYYKRFFIIISLVDENFQNYNEELNHRCDLLCSMIKKSNEVKIIDNKNDVLEILNFLYRL